jgi:peptidyl-prolyl cis-trans isomerase D
LLRYQQTDSSASRTDRKADSLANIAASQDTPERFDSAAKVLGLTPAKGAAIEGDALTIGGQYVPSVSAWAFSGVKPGATSELFDSDAGYVLAKLDSITPGGLLSVDAARDQVRQKLIAAKKIDRLATQAKDLAAAAAGSTLETAAQARNLNVVQSPAFTRVGFVPGLGRLNEAIGAAFSLPIGAVSNPIRTETSVIVMRVDRRVDADRAKFDTQKTAMRQGEISRLRQARVQAFLQQLRADAKISDRRKQLQQASRQATS